MGPPRRRRPPLLLLVMAGIAQAALAAAAAAARGRPAVAFGPGAAALGLGRRQGPERAASWARTAGGWSALAPAPASEGGRRGYWEVSKPCTTRTNIVRSAMSRKSFAAGLLALSIAASVLSTQQPYAVSSATVAATMIPHAVKMVSRSARSIFQSGHARGLQFLPPAPPGTEYRSIIADTGATLNCQANGTNCYNIKSGNIPVRLAAAGSDVDIKQYGNAAVVAFDEHGKSHVIRMGKTLIDPKLTNLLSPSAMFKISDDVYEAVLNRHDSHFRLFSGTKIPLRWDG